MKEFSSLFSFTVSLLSCSGSDGLVKLWTIKTNECVKTFDAHQDKVWALHGNSSDDLIVTGSADSNITVWKVCLPRAFYNPESKVRCCYGHG